MFTSTYVVIQGITVVLHVLLVHNFTFSFSKQETCLFSWNQTSISSTSSKYTIRVKINFLVFFMVSCLIVVMLLLENDIKLICINFIETRLSQKVLLVLMCTVPDH